MHQRPAARSGTRGVTEAATACSQTQKRTKEAEDGGGIGGSLVHGRGHVWRVILLTFQPFSQCATTAGKVMGNDNMQRLTAENLLSQYHSMMKHQ